MKTIFVDLDDTLINMARVKSQFFYEYAKIAGVEFSELQTVYENFKKTSERNSPGWEDDLLQSFADFTKTEKSDVAKIWNKQLEDIEVYDQVLDYVMAEEGKKILFSFGNEPFQNKKVEMLHLKDKFDEVIIVTVPKLDHLSALIQKDSKDFFENSEVMIIDDRQPFLNEVKLKFPKIKTILSQKLLADLNPLFPFSKENFLLAGKKLKDIGEIDIHYPHDILKLAKAFTDKLSDDRSGEIEKGATVKGQIHLGKNSIIKSGVYIEGNFYIGDNCIIGPNCFLKGFGIISDDSEVGNAVEFSRSVIGKNTNISHLSAVEDSVFGDNVRIGGGTLTANRRHSRKPIKLVIQDSLIDSKTTRLGAFLGDNVKTGVHNSLYPGVIIGANVSTLPGQIVDKNLL